MEVDSIRSTPLACGGVMKQMRLHTKLSPSECIERLRNPGAPVPALQKVMANKRYQLDDGLTKMLTYVDDAEFRIDMLGTGKQNTTPHRVAQLAGTVSPDALGGSRIEARRPWIQYIVVTVIILILLAGLVYIVASYPAMERNYLAPYPKMVMRDKYGHEFNPLEHLVIALICLPTLISFAVYSQFHQSRLFADFLCDLLEAKNVGKERKR